MTKLIVKKHSFIFNMHLYNHYPGQCDVTSGLLQLPLQGFLRYPFIDQAKREDELLSEVHVSYPGWDLNRGPKLTVINDICLCCLCVVYSGDCFNCVGCYKL